jgi:hypothetical protein
MSSNAKKQSKNTGIVGKEKHQMKKWKVTPSTSWHLEQHLNDLAQDGWNIFQIVIASQESEAENQFHIIAWREDSE